MSFEIRLVESAADRLRVQRQRYAIYVEELGYPQRYAQADARTVAEPLDDTGSIFGAFLGPRLVASVRVNYGDHGSFGEYEELYRMDRFDGYAPGRLCIVTKLMIDRAFRSGTLLTRLSTAMYEYTREFKPAMRFCLIDCVPRLETYFERIGYRRIGDRLQHPAAGWVVPLAFPIYDLEHFKKVGSPLARLCPRHDRVTAEWFRDRFPAGEAATARWPGRDAVNAPATWREDWRGRRRCG